MKRFFVAGIDTNVGKTLVSAILVQALQADYWKPVQTGTSEGSDSQTLRQLLRLTPQQRLHPESYAFSLPTSPHQAAAHENQEIDLQYIIEPQTSNHLIIEGAGGLLVPLNNRFLLIDLIQKLNAPVILVSRNYLGSINHTLLSVEALQRRGIPIAGIIFNGESNPASENFILQYTNVPCIAKIQWESSVDTEMVQHHAKIIAQKLQ